MDDLYEYCEQFCCDEVDCGDEYCMDECMEGWVTEDELY